MAVAGPESSSSCSACLSGSPRRLDVRQVWSGRPYRKAIYIAYGGRFSAWPPARESPPSEDAMDFDRRSTSTIYCAPWRPRGRERSSKRPESSTERTGGARLTRVENAGPPHASALVAHSRRPHEPSSPGDGACLVEILIACRPRRRSPEA